MIILQKLFSFKVDEADLVNVYMLYIRSILEQCCHVWHYTITEEDINDLETVQMVACCIILQNVYQCYEQALNMLELETCKAGNRQVISPFCKKMCKAFFFQDNVSSKHCRKLQYQRTRDFLCTAYQNKWVKRQYHSPASTSPQLRSQEI